MGGPSHENSLKVGGSAAVTLNCTGLGHAIQRVTHRLIKPRHVMRHKKSKVMQSSVVRSLKVAQTLADQLTLKWREHTCHDVTSLTI